MGRSIGNKPISRSSKSYMKINLDMKKWYMRNFCIISNIKAIEMDLTHIENIYGDEINKLNCRSIWLDSKQRKYRVKNLN